MRSTTGMLLVLFLTVSCRTPDGMPLVGQWECEDPATGGHQVLDFHEDGQARWTFDGEAEPTETFVLAYRVDLGRRPFHLDLSGFDRGPLQGMVLYGIFQFPDARTLELDCEPARAGLGRMVRPTAFTSDTLRYRRVD